MLKKLSVSKRYLLLFFVMVLSLQGLFGEEILEMETYSSTSGVLPGGKFKVALVINLIDPWHINSNKPLDDYTIATEVRMEDSDNYQVNKINFPEHEIVNNEALNKDLALFSGETVIILEGQVAENLQKGKQLTVKGDLYYQGCSDATCLAPREKAFQIDIPVVEEKTAIQEVNQEYFADLETGQEQEPVADSDKDSFNVKKSFTQRGTFLTFLLIFLGGLGLVLTPCIYPMIPITISYFGGQAGGKKSKRFFMALLYVLGLATTNSILGTLAALSGGLVGGLLSNPIVILVIAAILVGLALSMFGLYEITLPSALNQIGSGNEGGYIGSLIMGLTLGIVAAPCIGPFIIGLLTYVAAVGKPVLGFSMFFTLSMGMGLPFLILGYFSSQIDKLPNAGEWMVGVRRIFGFILIGMALYFLQPLIPDGIYAILFPFFLLGSGIYLLIFEKSGQNNRIFSIVKSVISIAAIFAAGWFMKPEQATASTLSMEWKKYEQEAYQEALADEKPIILDFTAEWCVKCKELEEITFKDPQVVELSKNYHLFKVDLTRRGTQRSEKIRKKFDIKGLPTIIFISPQGRERRDLRVFGFLEPEKFTDRMQKVD
ncbi:MAG TPA: cytochrome c biogenesis protein CcdA [bacterium]|nr:cytochrome c biogenesis protein CcdA [bacterium]